MAQIAPGDQIGNYRIERALEADEVSRAYEAMHLVLPRRAVIKVMTAAAAPGSARVLREAYILEALHHPGVALVYESGLLADRRPWSAREYVEGTTLEMLLRRGTLDRADAIALLRDLAGVLEHAHGRGVIHCGLRPSRVLITGRLRGYPLCLADWSCARAYDAAPAPCAVAPGARAYTAPELAAGAPIDGRTDVFALGAIGYRMLTGAEPYQDGPVAAAPGGVTSHVPAALRCPDAPYELTALIDQMLAHAQGERPSSAEVHEGLVAMADLLSEVVTSAPRIRRPRWTPPIAPADRRTPWPAPRDSRGPIERMFGDGIE